MRADWDLCCTFLPVIEWRRTGLPGILSPLGVEHSAVVSFDKQREVEQWSVASLRRPDALIHLRVPSKYPYRLNTQSTCEPEISRPEPRSAPTDRKSTRLNSSHLVISYA